ncbi:hypothetical protein GGR51DRAFT_526119 [Nemania sp. FL0031]|nr:hypothetical protein GGR51DRAFT_526119 [Nemania sp. FL0031]
MAIFVDLEEESEPPQTQALRGEWDGERAKLQLQQQLLAVTTANAHARDSSAFYGDLEPAPNYDMRENPNRNRITEAFGCYPIVIAIVSWLDLNSLDNLSRTCRQIRENLLQYRRPLVTRTLHCYKEQPPLEPEDNEMNWYYMTVNESYKRKGSCARDMVAECRRCAQPVCRNCVIRPPGLSTFRDRHRRLCIPCTKAPAAALTRPPLLPSTPIDADEMQRAICTCESDCVWLCHPCGRNIIGADQDYRSIWRWRNQYGEVLGGVGIGEGNRGVICGREGTCLGAREVEQETDCDAADAREHLSVSPSLSLQYSSPATTPSPSSSFTATSPLGMGMASASASTNTSESGSYRTPSPHSHSVGLVLPGSGSGGLRPGYARHEIEGIGGVVKTKLVRMLKVGACVPEWEDEKNKGQILEREVSGGRRSWCGWCLRVIPGARDRPSRAV